MSGMLISRLVLLVCVVLCVYVWIPCASSELICDGCMDGMPMPNCPNPAACGFKPVPCNCTQIMQMPMPKCYNYTVCVDILHCFNCTDGVATSGCPNPGACGFKPLQCQDCMTKSMPHCPDPAACTAAQCIKCMDGMPMPQCPYPAACGYKPFTCNDCVNGASTDGCPHPEYCGYAPATNAQCVNCMYNMSMPTCPNPDLCPPSAFSSDCMMSMVFGTSQDICILFQSWHVTNTGQYILAVFLITITCFVREWMAIYRSYRTQIIANQRKMGQSRSTSPAVTQAIDSLLYGASLTLSYILMLIFMTYNIGLCITVIIACIIGNYMWAWYFKNQKKRMKRDIDTITHDEHEATTVPVNYHRATTATTPTSATTTTSNNTNLSQPLLKPTDGDHCCEGFEFDD